MLWAKLKVMQLQCVQYFKKYYSWRAGKVYNLWARVECTVAKSQLITEHTTNYNNSIFAWKRVNILEVVLLLNALTLSNSKNGEPFDSESKVRWHHYWLFCGTVMDRQASDFRVIGDDFSCPVSSFSALRKKRFLSISIDK